MTTMLEVDHYYYLHPLDAPRHNATRPPRIMSAGEEVVMHWSSLLPILIPNAKLDELIQIDRDWAKQLNQTIDWSAWMLDNLRSLHAQVIDTGLLVLKSVGPLNSGSVNLTIQSTGKTYHYSMFSDLFIRPVVVRTESNLFKVSVHLLTARCERIAEL